MAASVSWGSTVKWCVAPLKGFGFKVDPWKNYLAVSMHCGGPFVGTLMALILQTPM